MSIRKYLLNNSNFVLTVYTMTPPHPQVSFPLLSQGQRAHDAGPLLEPGLPDVQRGDSGRAHPHILRGRPWRQHSGHLQQLRASLHQLPEAGESLLHAGNNPAGRFPQPGEKTKVKFLVFNIHFLQPLEDSSLCLIRNIHYIIF